MAPGGTDEGTHIADGSMKREGDMTSSERDNREAGGTPVKTGEPASFDPRDTEHPAGPQQAAENTANDPPS